MLSTLHRVAFIRIVLFIFSFQFPGNVLYWTLRPIECYSLQNTWSEYDLFLNIVSYFLEQIPHWTYTKTIHTIGVPS